MKKIISSIIAAAMALTCFSFGALSADAVEKNSSDKTISKNQLQETVYKEGEALVVFKAAEPLPVLRLQRLWVWKEICR